MLPLLLPLLMLAPAPLCTGSADAESVVLLVNTNNVAGSPWRGSSEGVKYLGLFNTTAQCQ